MSNKKYQGGTASSLVSLIASLTIAAMVADGWWIALAYYITQAVFSLTIGAAKWEVYNIDIWKKGAFTQMWTDALRGGK